MKILNLFQDLFYLFYPIQCALCENNLLTNEKTLCTECLCELPRTNYHLEPDNEVEQMFWGRVLVEHATAWLYFQKGGKVQSLLHKFKYMNQKRIGYDLGRMIGVALKKSCFNEIDLIIPVPLHQQQLAARGYNQSEWIARGLAESMDKPLDRDTLCREVANPSQTKKHRYQRWSNVKGIFALRDTGNIENKHVLLVDDVITTGATLEACASALLKGKHVKVSIFALAKA